MSGRPPTDGPAQQQLGGNQLDRSPVSSPREYVLSLGEQAALESLGPPFARSLHRQPPDILLIAGGPVPGVFARMPCLGCDSTERDEDLALQPVLRRPKRPLAKLTLSQPLAVGQDTDTVDRPAQR